MNRNIKLLWAADATSIFGTAIYTLALTLLSFEFTDSVFGAGAILFTSIIPYFFIGIFAGVISDRVDRKKLMILSDILRGILSLSIPIAYDLNILTIQQIVIVSFLITTLRAFFHPANQASVPLLVDDMKDLNKVNSYIGSTQNLGMMLGPTLGGILLIFNFNVSQLLYIDSLTYFLSALFIYFIKFPETENDTGSHKTSILTDAWNGIKFISIENKPIAIIMIAFATQLLVGVGVTQLGIPKILSAIDISSDSMFGYILSVIALASTIASFWLASRKVKRPVIWIFTGYGIRGIAFFLLGIASGIESIIIAAVIIGFGSTISGTTMTTLLQVMTPNNMLGKVMAVRSSIGNIADAFAFLIVGGILSVSSLLVAFTIIAIYVFATTGLLSYFWYRSINKNSSPQAVYESSHF
ncbi:MAG TPA: MFS transporter [Bacillus sp. (in: firmicutes)]|uniref:MFS transporter n=1 Tax=Bacillus litorisediminis TaxID=2922713 RepID=UPI001FAC0C99|nr:MFS transporter [Bacillus litorisediminis]HWO75948.1 MFS transporter [Bacillus sp. (in: firmicutes)]